MTRRPRAGSGRAMRGSGYPGGPSGSIEQPIQMTNLKAWWDSRTTAQMSPSPETGIQTWTSRAGAMGPVVLSQATPAARPVYVASVPQFGGKPGVRFDGVDDALEALIASDWTFLHAGTGSTMFVYLRMDSTGPAGQRLWSTCPGNPTDVGIQLAFASATAAAVRYCNGSGTYLNSATLATAGHVERDVPRWQAFSHGGGVRAAHAGGGAAISTNGDVGGQVGSASAPGSPLRVGGTGSTNALKGWVAQILLYDRVLSASEIASLGAFFDSIYLETPQQIPGLKCWHDSRTAAQMTLETGVRTWRPRAGSMGAAADLWQASSVAQPPYVASSAPFGGRPAVSADGVDDFLAATTSALSDWVSLHSGTGSTIFVVRRCDSTGIADQPLLTTSRGSSTFTGVYWQLRLATLSLTVCNGAAFVNALSSAASAHITRDVAAWQAWTYGAGLSIAYAGGGVVATQADVGGQLPSLGSPEFVLRLFKGGSTFYKGQVAQLLIYDRVLSASEIASLGAWAAAEYGVAA